MGKRGRPVEVTPCPSSSPADAACAQVIFLLGEIDCREGLLLAVDKLKYDSVEEAMDVLADIYAAVLTRLVEERDLTAYVHPVPPVLNETRHIVMPFNAVVKEKVRLCIFSPGVLSLCLSQQAFFRQPLQVPDCMSALEWMCLLAILFEGR